MPELTRGANVAIATAPLSISVSGAAPGAVDLMVFQLTPAGRVRNDADFVFFNQPASPEGAVKLVAADHVSIDLGAVPTSVQTLAVAVALDDSVPGSLAGIAGLAVGVTQPGSPTVSAPALGLSSERAAALVEVYRRGDGWKLRNVSAGWDRGLAALVTEYGVSVDDAPAANPVAAPAAPPAGDGVRTVADEAKLSLDKRQKLDLRKRAVADILRKKSATGIRARVVLVIDKTGSMHAQYKKQVVNRVVERMVAVATQIDDDGKLEPYLYGSGFARLPDISVHEADEWSRTYLHLSGRHGGIDYGPIGAINDEIPIMSEIISGLRRGGAPTLVLFFTDGGFSKKREITALMQRASHLPAFWQFVGIGKANYGLLEKLDNLGGRAVDNAGFFAVDDIDTVADDELYRRLLSEFPDWLRAAQNAGISG